MLHSFGGEPDGAYPAASLINVKGTLYGTTYEGGTGNCAAEFYNGCGTVFALDPATGAETVLYSFTNDAVGSPEANLIKVNGILYGTASAGDSCCGAVFSLDPKTNVETQLYSFRGRPDGEFPTSALINVKGTLYSTTFNGGTDGWGAVFSITP